VTSNRHQPEAQHHSPALIAGRPADYPIFGSFASTPASQHDVRFTLDSDP
jgi:hypothetical protein